MQHPIQMKLRKGAAIALTTLMTLAAGDALAARCLEDPIPSGWLERQEQAGGRTIKYHVALTDTDLTEFLSTNTNWAFASSFPDPRTAEAVVGAAVLPEAKRLNDWARTANLGDGAELRMEFEQPIGRYVARNDNATDAFGVRVVLEADGKGGCKLLFAHPTQ